MSNDLYSITNIVNCIDSTRTISDVHNNNDVVLRDSVNCYTNNVNSRTTSDDRNNAEILDNNYENSINIYRYKFSEKFIKELFIFSKIHQYDHRKDFKEAWKLWLENNDELVTNESNRLVELCYEGDILDKMFKSARYYFRKKNVEKKQPKTRNHYISVQKELIDAMDAQIQSGLLNADFKPSDGFEQFCKNKNNFELLTIELNILYRQFGLTDSTEIKNKIKKTYKNRYYLLINNKNK
jgi:hypothetical protein